LTGVSHGQISRIERGHQPYTQHTLEKLAAALGTDPAALILQRPRSQNRLEALLGALSPADSERIALIAQALAAATADVPQGD
jgi:transcriptional regulator with XRE-family HTH domain